MGGALFSLKSAIEVDTCDFHNNSAIREGGVLHSNKAQSQWVLVASPRTAHQSEQLCMRSKVF